MTQILGKIHLMIKTIEKGILSISANPTTNVKYMKKMDKYVLNIKQSCKAAIMYNKTSSGISTAPYYDCILRLDLEQGNHLVALR